ncbi:MAG: hypothetical protein P1V51_21765 [Deltaproteobacteria bacterium]|nr:hypothetical protein [Deltaproteobacteria bacterium]
MARASEHQALLSAARAYLPRWVFQAAGRGESLREPRSLHACVLLVDMAGFTSLTTRLEVRGAAGTEEVFDRLGAWFQAVLAPILDNGGDVVAFGGDCCTALFEGPSRPDRLRRAVEVAARIIEDSPIPVRVGVADGPVSVGTVGTERTRQPVTLGFAVRTAATAMELAAEGEVWAPALHDELPVADAGQGFGAVRLPSPAPRPAPLAPEEEPIPAREEEAAEGTLRAFFAPAIWDALLLPPELGEHRTVTTLFARLEKTDHTDPGLAAVEAALDHAAGVIERQGGYLQKIESAEKGTLLIAFFGLPLAQPDPARRALMAARALTARGALTASLTTGRVFAGVLGSPRRHEHTAIGAPVNLAARLLQSAEAGTLVCDENTRAALEDLRFKELSAIEPKGFSRKMKVFTPEAGVERLASYEVEERTPMVGRREFLARLTAWLEQAAAEPLTLQGPTGIGKSRLVRETSRLALALGLSPVLGHFGGSESQSAIHELTRALGGKVGDDPLGDLAEAAEAAGAASTLLILEDLHLAAADELQSVVKLALLAERLGFLLLATSRNPEVSLGTVLEVPPLPELQASELARHFDPRLEEGPAMLIAQRSLGNPLYVEALVRHREEEAGALPASLEAALRLRIDSLSPVQRRVLLAASVLGMHVEPELLSRVVEDVPPEAVAGAIRHLVGEGFLGRVGDHLRFTHDLERRTAYETLPFRARQGLHSRVLRELEAREEVHPEALLEHLVEAGETDRLAQLAYEAAQEASRLGASTRCLELTALGLEHTDDELLRCKLEIVRVRALALTLEREQALELATRLVHDARRLRLDEDEASLYYDLASIHSRLARYPESDEAITRGLARAAALGDGLLQAKFLMVQGWNAWGRGLYPDARQYLEEALRVAPDAPLFGIRSALATVMIQLGHYQQALEVLPPHESTEGAARAAMSFDRGLVAYFRAQPKKVAEYLEAVRQAALSTGDTRFTADLAARTTYLHELQGRWSEASTLRRRTIEAYTGVGMRYESVGCRLDDAVERLLAGKLSGLERRFAEIQEEAEEIEAGDEVARAEVLGAACRLLTGTPGRAAESLLELNWRHARRSGRWRLEVELRGLDLLVTSAAQRRKVLERSVVACRERGDCHAERFLLLLARQGALAEGDAAEAASLEQGLEEALERWGCSRWTFAP